MKSVKKFLAATLAIMHLVSYSASAQQVINIQEGTSTQTDNINVAAGEQLTINVVNALGEVCPSCRGILESNSLLNNGAIDIWGILAIIAPSIINNGVITVQGDLLLSNLGINKDQFFAGIAELSKDPSLANGYILNTGEIKNLTQGLIALVGANGGVHNLGTISSNGGVVAMAAGDKATFPLTRDGALNINLEGVTGLKGQVFDKDGNLVETNGLVTNSGLLQANGGAVVLQAAGAEALYDSIINHTGIIEAKSIAQENGKIILKSETGNIYVNNATIDATGLNTGEKGGSIQLLTKGNVIVDGTTVIDASGDIGGGEILIGSDVNVTGPVTAQNVFVGSDVSVKADAVTNGNGGKIIVGAREVALTYGDFSAKGGAQSGNGGFIETSGKEYLDVDGIGIDASAANGKAGTWLLDPRNVEIRNQASSTGSFNGGSPNVWTPTATGSGGTSSVVSRNTIQTTLAGGTDVTINTNATIGSQDGNITVFDSIVAAIGGDGVATLTLNALGFISIGASITATAGILNLVLNAAGAITQTAGTITANNVSFTAGGAVALAQAGNIWNTITGTTTAGAINIADSATNTTIQDLKTVGSTVTYIHTGAGNVTVTGVVSSGKADPAGANGGNISITSSNALTVANTATVSSVKGAGGVVTIGGATVNGTVIAGAGNVTLNGTGLDAIISSPIISAINYILSAVRDVIINSTITTSAGSNVTITADSDLDGSGGVWIKQAGGIDSAGNVTLTGSALFDPTAGGESVRIDADGSNNQILAVGDITLQKSAVAPSTADIVVNGIVKTTGVGKTITVNSNDTITSSDNGVAEFIGANLSLTAKNGIDVESDVTNASFNNSTSGNVGIEDMTGGLTVNGATNGGSGSTTILTHSPLTIAANMIQAGAINLTAGESAAATDHLTVNSGITVESTGSTVTLNAGDNVVLSSTSVVKSATSTVDITAGSGDTDTIGSISLGGLVSAATTATLTAAVGAITDTNGATNNVTATSLTVASATGIDLDTTITTLTNANVTGTGAIDINDLAGGLAVTSATTNSGKVTVNATSGNLDVTTATAGGGNDINLGTITSGNIRVDNATATGGNIVINSAGSIQELNADATADLTASGLDLTAVNGIGSLGAIEINATTLINANVTGTGAVDITDLTGGLAVTSATTNSGKITLNATGGNLDITTATAGGGNDINLGTITSGNIRVDNATATGGDIVINSAGTIQELNADAAADLTASGLDLTAVNGIGSLGTIEINATTLINANVSGTGAIDLSDTAGGLAVTSATTNDGAITINATGGNLDATTVTAGGAGRNVILSTTTSGNVNVGNVTATGDNIAITSAGAIEELGSDAAADLTSGTMNLNSATGIGAAAQLEIDGTTLTNASVSGTGAINVSDTTGGLAVTSATTNSGKVTVNATSGNLDVTTATAGGGNDINLGTITSGNIRVDNATATGGNIVISSAGTIQELNADAAADLTASGLDLTAMSGIGSLGTIEINATTLINANVSGTGAIDLSDTAGGLAVTSATTNDGAITINATSGNLDAATVTAGGIGRNILLTTTTSGNIRLGTVSALLDTATITSAGTIGELTNDDLGVQNVDLLAGTINLTTAGGDIGAFASYLDIQPTTLWNATSNGGGIFISCVGTCPMGQIDAGTGSFYYAGNITDGNDVVNGEVNAGLWNIRAGGVHLDADNAANGFIGTASNWIEMQLANYAGVAGDLGRLVATAGTGGIHVSNDGGAGHPGLQIGGVSPSTITGITSSGNIEIYSFSPLTVAANVLATNGSNILLAAMGNSAADDLTVNANISATGGNGAIKLSAGDDINVNGTSVVSASGTGLVTAVSGDDFTDLNSLNHNGTATGSVVMSSGSALRSQNGNIVVDASGSARISEVNANSNNDATIGNVTMHARSGFVSDTNGATVNVTANQLVVHAVQGIGDGTNGDSDILETNINTLDAINTGTGAIRVDEVTAGRALGISRAQQTNANSGGIQIRTGNGNLTVLGGGFPNVGVSSASTNAATTVRLEARGTGANDDLILNNTVTTNASKVELYSSSRDVIVNVGGNITSTTGEIEANATRDIFMADTTVASAGSGIIDFDSGRNTTLSEVVTSSNATDAVTINAGNNILGFTGAVVNGSTSGVNITTGASGRATIQALTGVGSSKAITTSIGTLDVRNFLTNNINVTEVTAGGDMNILRANQTALTGNMNIFTTNGNLTVLDAVAGGVGTLATGGATRLWAQGVGDLLVNNVVNSATGKINLDSDNNAIFSVKGDVTSLAGEIEVDAVKDITMSDNLGVDGTIFNAGLGKIDLDAGGNITLASVQTASTAADAVVIVASGKIIDGGDTNVNIKTGTNGGMLLSANSGIGSIGTGVNVNPNSAANNFATDAIDTQGGRLAAVTQTGDIQISNTGALEITTLTDTDPNTSLGTPSGVGTVTGVLNNDIGHVDPSSIIFITTHSPMTISSAVTNLDGGNISLYAIGNLATDTMTINANVQTKNGNGDVRLVSGGDMTLAAGVNVSTQGDGVTSGTGRVAMGAGYNATGKTQDAAIDVNPLFIADTLPGLGVSSLAETSTDPAASSLFGTGTPVNAAANLTMDETSRISTEGGSIIVDAQNNFTVGRVDADGNQGLNGITDGTRGNILAFARNGSILDAEGPGEIGNLDFVANSLAMLAKGTIGTVANHIEGDAPFLNTFSNGDQFVDMQGNTQVEMTSTTGSIFLSATNNIVLGHVSAPSGTASLRAGNDIVSLGGSEARVTAGSLIRLLAGGVIGTTSNPIVTQLNNTPAQIDVSAGARGGNGVSAVIFSNVSPAAINVIGNPPGLVLFNNAPIAGQPLQSLTGSQSTLFFKPFVRGLRQYSDVNGEYAADFPGFNNIENLAFSPNLAVDTSVLDQVPLRGITTAPRVVPIPAPAKPTPVPVQPEQNAAQQPSAPVLSQEPTPPAVVPIPANATPSSESKTKEGTPQTPSASN